MLESVFAVSEKHTSFSDSTIPNNQIFYSAGFRHYLIFNQIITQYNSYIFLGCTKIKLELNLQIQKIIKYFRDMIQSQMNFQCCICLGLAKDAVQTQCCGQILCDSCFLVIKKQHNLCSYCRELNVSAKPSFMARRIINGMKVQCQGGCEQSFMNSQKEKHLVICPKRKIACKHCKRNFEIKKLADHMSEKHEQELIGAILAYHLQEKQPKLQSKLSKVNEMIFERRMKNSNGDLAEWGENGKYYCGKKNLVGKCGCCDGHCGTTNGENCDACMKLDVQRFKLQKGFLVNPKGKICKLGLNGTYYCGLQINTRRCVEENNCFECSRTTKSVNKFGRYKQLV